LVLFRVERLGEVEGMRLEHKAGIDIIYELALRLYPSCLESFREAISNSLDEGSEKVQIQCSRNEVMVEDWGEGIADLEKFRTFGDYAKAKRSGETIGMKGLGKLSLLRMGKNVIFNTNNGKFGININMTPEYLDADMGAKEEFLDHQGTRVNITNPAEIPPIDDLSDYLKRAFGLRIARGTEITLNGVTLTSKVDHNERFLFRLKGGIDVTGNIKQAKKGRGSLDVYVKHVFITSLLVDPERNFDGWVNCNELIPTTSRNELVKDRTYSDFNAHLKAYVTKFPKKEEDIGRDEVRMGNELSKLMKNYLKDMKLLPEGKLPFGKGTEKTFTKREKRKRKWKERLEKEKEEPPDYVKLHTSINTTKPIRRTKKTDYGIMWVDQDYGNEKEPLFYVEPNIIVRNRTNALYRFALKNKASLGPKWLRLLPYLSRVAVSINPKAKNWMREETNLEVDKATCYFLRKQGEL
jgi:hypothetical protein